MFFKVVLNKEVHIFNPKTQSNFAALTDYIKDVFKQLPAKYQLSYLDEENDEITLANENDFKIMKETANKTVKIFIKAVNEDFYDETQKVILDDEVEQVKEAMQKIDIQEKAEEEVPSQSPVFEEESQMNSLDQSSVSIADSQISEVVIEEKMMKMMPGLIEQVKQSILKESAETNGSILKEEPKKEEIPVFSNSQPKISEPAVHPHIICDDCGMDGLVGVRYKCAVCADFDLCENCEAVSEHEHPFLKIKTPKQAPYKIIAIVNDDHDNSLEVNGQKIQLPPFVNNLFGAFMGGMRPPQDPQQQGAQQPPRGRCGPQGGMWGKKCDWGKKMEKCAKKAEKFMAKCEQMQRQQTQQEEKPEYPKPEEPKVEEEPSKKVKVDEPLIPDNQPIIEEEKKETVVVEEPKKEEAMTEEQILMDNATYLSDILDIDFNRCYKFSVKNAGLSKEELLELYFVNTRAI